jgi:hypothetical protein
MSSARPLLFPHALSIAAITISLAIPRVTFAAENLDSDRPEAWAMFYFTSVSLFSGLGTPRARKPKEVELGLELASIPHLDSDQRRVGFEGTKVEDLNKAPLFGRGRLTVGLPWKLGLAFGYVPPIEVFGVRAHMFGLALERPFYERGPLTLGARAYGQVGRVVGAFTCPSDAAGFPPGSQENPSGCNEPSKDRTYQRHVGLELSSSYRLDALRGLTPYVSVAGNYLNTKFRVIARTFDVPDRTRLRAETGTFTLGTGVSYPLGKSLEWSLGLAYTPLWVTRPPATSEERDSLLHARTLLSYRFR